MIVPSDLIYSHPLSHSLSRSLANARASTYFVTYKIYTGTTPVLIKKKKLDLNGWKFCAGCQKSCTRGSVPCFKVVTYPNGAVRSRASSSVSALTTGPRPSCVRARGDRFRRRRGSLRAPDLHAQNENHELRLKEEETLKTSVCSSHVMDRSAPTQANGRVYSDNDCVSRRPASSMF